MKYITIILTTLLISSCGVKLVRPWVVSDGNTNYSPTAPAKGFSEVDLDHSGGISKSEYDASAPPPREIDIDISTPITIFAWVIAIVLIICILSVVIPKWANYLKNRQSVKKYRTDEDSEHVLLNE